ATWQIENSVLDGMGSDYYVEYTGDTYNFAPPKDDIIAFVVGKSWYDLFLMKSTDGGETFEKTLIWEHPYPFFDPQNMIVTDTFYCADGSHTCVIDMDGMVHVAFGINRAYSDGTSSYWFPYVDGIAYWNENMPAFSDDLNALNPYGHPDSELIEDYNLIGWTQDVNNNGQIDLLDEIGTYYLGLSSMPQLVLGDNNQLFLIFSSATETYDNSIANYRHLWARMSPDGGSSWNEFLDLTSGLIHIYDECVYPSCASNSDDNIHLVYQTDIEPGVSIWGTLHAPVDNKTIYMKVLKIDITGMKENREIIYDYNVSQNYPNPFNSTSVVNVNIRKTTELCLEIVNLMGQNVFKLNAGVVQPGMNKITIDATELTPGIYFYTVKAGDASITKKMIVE
nr:T9SS type A sorting domain-containing protein [Bacteroidota bacterium]